MQRESRPAMARMQAFTIKGRLSFYHATGEQGGTAGAPSCLIAFDKENTAVLERCGIEGKLVKL